MPCVTRITRKRRAASTGGTVERLLVDIAFSVACPSFFTEVHWAKLARDDQIHILKQHRRKELETRQKQYRWTEWNPGFPLSIDAKCHKDLPRDIQFDSEKGVDFVLNYSKAMENLFINRFMHMFQSSWNDFADFEKIFVKISNTISERVMNHWQEDLMFGYQFLNGCNPVLIRRCTKLPEKLPVTTEMVECSLERQLTLEEEVEQGNIFIVDFELLDGIDANKTDPCTLQFLAAPICLLYKNRANKIVPIAIQLNQVPGEENPIFLPSDAKYDWLLAKIWVRSSDFHVHQTITHLLCTHLVSEVFGIAMYRQLPAVHPIFKLLVAHVRFTIAINTKAREQLICEYGLFDKANATGGGGHVQMVQKAMRDLTYPSLCFPEAIKARGMDSTEDIPYYFYRDDGLLVWEAIKTFTADVVNIYYESDQVVVEDQELQDFVKDVYVYGMRGKKASGFPKSLKSREQLCEYLTVVIFTASAQHAAVNFGQVGKGRASPPRPEIAQVTLTAPGGRAGRPSSQSSLGRWGGGLPWQPQGQEPGVPMGILPTKLRASATERACGGTAQALLRQEKGTGGGDTGGRAAALQSGRCGLAGCSGQRLAEEGPRASVAAPTV
nr:arachidonate 5-lipoxygenase isoform X3 [Equus caballus]